MWNTTVRYLVLPGWHGSPADHWQSHWLRCLPNAQRVVQDNWVQPQREAWVATLERYVLASDTPVILIAHSLGCITIAHWAKQASSRALALVQGALLVAPADVERLDCPAALQGFAPLPQQVLPFASLLIGSDTDPAASAHRALALAQQWGAEATILAEAGHINVSSGHHRWEQGFAQLYRLQSLIEQRTRRRA